MDGVIQKDCYEVRLATGAADVRAAQSLRYDVFVQELGGSGPGVDHAARLETDRFDAFADHLMLSHVATGELVGVYRLMTRSQAAAAGGFYGASEFDLSPLLSSGQRLLELGRSCIARAHRSGTGMFHLWAGLSRYVHEKEIDTLFGVASLPGCDPQALAAPLSLLFHRHRAPGNMRPRARSFQTMDLIAEHDLDRRQALLEMPALIKAYLRLGGQVGDGAFVDTAFNCTDVCMILDTTRLDARHSERYLRASQ